MGLTIRQIINVADDIRSNSISDSKKISWLSRFDEKIYQNIILKHEDHEDYGDISFPYTSDETILIAPDRFAEMYETYLCARIDYEQSETAFYNNDSLLHNTAYNEFEAWYNENHLPLSKHKFRTRPRYGRREASVFGN